MNLKAFTTQPRAPAFSAACSRSSRRRIIPCVSSAEPTSAEPQQKMESQESQEPKLYVGKGKYVKKSDVGSLFTAVEKTGRDSSLTGGFAGGEVGLKSLVASLPPKEAKPAKEQPKKPAAAKKDVYIGKGRYFEGGDKDLVDVIQKSRRDGSLTGGFAGGERGLRAFVDTGAVPFAPEGQGRKQQSPLIVAGVVSILAVTGGIFMTDVEDLGEKALTGASTIDTSALAVVDDNTKMMLEIAVILFGIVGITVGGNILVSKAFTNVREAASKMATLGAFMIACFIAARFILAP